MWSPKVAVDLNEVTSSDVDPRLFGERVDARRSRQLKVRLLVEGAALRRRRGLCREVVVKSGELVRLERRGDGRERERFREESKED